MMTRCVGRGRRGGWKNIFTLAAKLGDRNIGGLGMLLLVLRAVPADKWLDRA